MNELPLSALQRPDSTSRRTFTRTGWPADAAAIMSRTMAPSSLPTVNVGTVFFRYMPGVVTSEYHHHYFHTDLETPETVPWTGLEASTRAYAKIIDEVNKLPLSALQRPEELTIP